METYTSNSHKAREEQQQAASPEKKVEKVISGSAKPKKKGEMQKLANIFISEDVGNVKSYILMEVLVPAIKKALLDIVTNGADMILYGEAGRSKRGTTASKVSYGKFYDRDYGPKREYRSSRGYDYDDIIFETRGDAERVLDSMNEIISQYGVVSVLDFYDLADVSTDNYAADKYGWEDIRTCKPVRVRDGYILKLPRAVALN